MTASGDLVWYVGYGSNLSSQRFAHYIARCRDTTPPRRSAGVEISHRLIFARESVRWRGGGVAFLDPRPAEGERTLARAWLVTWEQFSDVLAQECRLPVGSIAVPGLLDAACMSRPGHWYGCVVHVGDHEGWSMVTFTDEAAAGLELRPPGPRYRAEILKGLAESHGLSSDEAAAYITRHSVKAPADAPASVGDPAPSPG